MGVVGAATDLVGVFCIGDAVELRVLFDGGVYVLLPLVVRVGVLVTVVERLGVVDGAV